MPLVFQYFYLFFSAESSSKKDSPAKKKKKTSIAAYKVQDEVMKLIKEDNANKKTWDEALESRSEGAQKFLAQVEELFGCICCQEIVFKPVTTTCSHNVCKVS